MSEPLVSVIVPVYNAEKYLKRCLDSILRQTYRNTEIILVDDGSTDKSGKICSEYRKKDKRVRVISQKNSGVAMARNAGLRKARGEYIAFIDSDDWVDKKYLEKLLRKIQKEDIDIVQCGQIIVDEKNSHSMCDVGMQSMIVSGREACEKMLYQKIITSALWGKMIRKDLFDGLSFKAGIIHEDLRMLYDLFRKSKRVAVIGDLLYYYFERKGSLIRMNFSENTLDVLSVVDEIVMDTRDDADLHHAAISRKINADFFVLRQLPKKYKKMAKDLKNEIVKHRGELLKNPKVRAKTKVALRLSYFGMPVVKILFKLAKNGETVRRIS